MSHPRSLFTAALVLGCGAAVLCAQTPGPFQRPGGAPAAKSASAPVSIDPRDGAYPSLGRADAPVLIVEFSEFGCPYCRRHAASVLPAVIEKYVETGAVRYLFVQVPPEGELSSEVGAIALLCAARLGALLPVYHRLFDTASIDWESADAAASAAGIREELFTGCTRGSEVRGELQRHIEFARRRGVLGTPTFAIGRARDGRLVDAVTTFGIQKVSYFESVVDRLLKARK